jgi:GNAT superfamily N-acetyltransferase
MERDDEVRRLERVLLATWPAAEVVEEDGWVLSANHGATSRANSLTVLGQSSRSVPAAVTWMEDWYRYRALVPMVRATPLSGHDLVEHLENAGYEPWPAACDILRRSLLETPEVPTGVTLEAKPTDRWFSRSERPASMWPELRDMATRVNGSVVFASVSVAEDVVAIGQGVVADSHLAIYGMSTASSHRGRGLGRRIIGSLEAWAVSVGATAATLQVVIDNDVAQHLYRRVGYEPVYQYRYLRAPE